MSRQSEERVRQLCRKVITTAQESPEFSPAVNELRIAIREHCDAIRDKVAELALVIASESDTKAAA